MIRGSEEGRIVSFKDKNIVEIEIEDGFVIPALIKDVVVVSKEENEYFETRKNEFSKPSTDSQPALEISDTLNGIFLAYIPINETDIALHFINLSDSEIIFNLSEKYGERGKSIGAGNLSPNKAIFITYFKLSEFDIWPEFLIQTISINSDIQPLKNYSESTLKLKAATFFKSKRNIPVIQKTGFLIPIKNEKIEIKPEILKDQLLGNNTIPMDHTIFKVSHKNQTKNTSFKNLI